MAPDGIPWTCPYCGRPTTLTEHNHSSGQNLINIAVSEHGENIGLSFGAVACPNPGCRKLELTVSLITQKYMYGGGYEYKDTIQSWNLLPESSAKPQPNCIPEALRNDYLEACRIAALSPNPRRSYPGASSRG